MNPEIKQEWVAALRSGKYKQGRKRLNTDDKYCCLGVLCEIAVAHGITEKATPSDLFNITCYGGCNTSSLPREVVEWSGVSAYGDLSGQRSLSELNDIGRSFSEIATIIEAEL